ncbi:hypothetical protein EPUL_002116, partial [Erysiphe pulchra]
MIDPPKKDHNIEVEVEQLENLAESQNSGDDIPCICQRRKRAIKIVNEPAAIRSILHLEPGPSQWLVRQIHRRAQELKDYGVETHIRWVPGHAGVESNENADQAAKDAAKTGIHCRERFNSLSHMSRLITECKRKEDRKWFRAQHQKRKPESRSTYKLLDNKQMMDKAAAGAKKGLACLYYQLKLGHAHTADYLFNIGKNSSRSCSRCQNAGIQTVRHLMMDCRKWRQERDTMWAEVKKKGCTLNRNWEQVRDIFVDEKATASILRFLLCIGIGRKYNEEEVEERERNRLLDIDELPKASGPNWKIEDIWASLGRDSMGDQELTKLIESVHDRRLDVRGEH